MFSFRSEFKVGINILFSASDCIYTRLSSLFREIVAQCPFGHQKEEGLSFRENETR